jgi:hypothetical protein
MKFRSAVRVTTFVELVKDGAYMAGDRRVITPSGRSGGIHFAGWQATRWQRWRLATPYRHASRPVGVRTP